MANIDSSTVDYNQSSTGATLRTVKARLQDYVSVKDFGAKGDGTTDDWLAIKSAMDYINSAGGSLYFPPGKYRTTYKPHAVKSNWIEIKKSGVEIFGDQGAVQLENFLFYIHGMYGDLIAVGSTPINNGDNAINTAAAHGLKVGDYIQLLSAVNAYTIDAAEWQLGSENPTERETPLCRHAEIHRIETVTSATTAIINGSVIYGNYRNTTSGQSYPMPEVDGAEIRPIIPVEGVCFSGISFKCVENNFRGILCRAAKDILFHRCHFESAETPGAHFKSTDTWNLRFEKCTSYRKPSSNVEGSSWNTFIIGGGCQSVYYSQCRFVGEWQTIDFSPNSLNTDIDGYDGVLRCGYLTTQIFGISNCEFFHCNDGGTAHPGTYSFDYSNNKVVGCSTGCRARAKKTTISSNSFTVVNVGIAVSAFYDDMLIIGNNISRTGNSTSWVGIAFNPMSNEIMNNNNVQNVVVTGNIIANTGGLSEDGVLFYHRGNGVPPDGFTGFTDAVKTARSNYHVVDNVFTNCGIRLERFISGVTIKRNAFSGTEGVRTHYIYCGNHSSASFISENYFKDSKNGIFIGSPSQLVYSFEKRHGLGKNESQFLIQNSVDINNIVPIYSETDGDQLNNKFQIWAGGEFQAIRRANGTSALNINSTPTDGVSASEIRILPRDDTTGSKLLRIYANTESRSVYPSVDATYSSGLASRRWSTIYSSTSVINTSDKNTKQDIRPLNEKELAVAKKIKESIKAFRFQDSVQRKSSSARIHFGVIAQEIRDIFESEGLDAHSYGLFCYDSWESVDPIINDAGEIIQQGAPAGENYGIRYDELLAFIIAAH